MNAVPFSPMQGSLDQVMRGSFPGVEMFTETDELTREISFHAELHLRSGTYRITEERIVSSDGHAGVDAMRASGEELQQIALDSLNLRPLIEQAKSDERAKYEAAITQLDGLRQTARDRYELELERGKDPEAARAAHTEARIFELALTLLRSIK